MAIVITITHRTHAIKKNDKCAIDYATICLTIFKGEH